MEPDSWRTLYAHWKGKMIPLDCWRTLWAGRETVELSHPKSPWIATLELTRTPSGFGGSCAYWLCPHCGRRARFLYFKSRGFLCRECAKLNYRCQQRTKDFVDPAYDGIQLAWKRLRWRPPGSIVPADFPYITPDRPKGMHQTTYRHYLARYRRYQEKYRRECLRKMMAIRCSEFSDIVTRG